MKLIVATGNAGKLREIRQIMKDLPVDVVSMKDEGIVSDPEENGKTFMENARIKVKAIGARKNTIVLADDSGLEVDAMDGQPGVFSARFLGYDTDYATKNAYIIDQLLGVEPEKRGARFVCSMAALLPDGQILESFGVMEGRIAYEAAGSGGFGYDPIFYLPEYKKTSAELTADQKNAISHRGRALREMEKKISRYLFHHGPEDDEE